MLSEEERKKLALAAARVNGEEDAWEEYLDQIQYWIDSIEAAGMMIVDQEYVG